MRYHITINGPFKPYTRMTQGGKWVRPDARAYLDSQDALKTQLVAEMIDRPMLPESTPLIVDIVIQHAGGFHNRDLDNEAKAILDAMQGIVFKDDRWIDQLLVSRERGPEEQIHIWVEVSDGDDTGRV